MVGGSISAARSQVSLNNCTTSGLCCWLSFVLNGRKSFVVFVDFFYFLFLFFSTVLFSSYTDYTPHEGELPSELGKLTKLQEMGIGK